VPLAGGVGEGTADGMSWPPYWREHLIIRSLVLPLGCRTGVEAGEGVGLLFVGDDWSEQHHDVELQDESGRRLGRARLAEGVAGIARLHELIPEQLDEDAGPEQVVVGIETDRGPWVVALVAAGYQVYAINPLQVARYRERHRTSGAKSDTADAHTLADMVRTDRHQLRPVAGDSDAAEAVQVLARAHQQLIWERTRHLLRLRSALREFYPADLVAFGEDLAGADALELLAAAPDPGQRGQAVHHPDQRRTQAGPTPPNPGQDAGDPGRPPILS
jgi:transposase